MPVTYKNIHWNDLLAYWKMDEASWAGVADEVEDATGNGYDGTAEGLLTTAAGLINNCANFPATPSATKYISGIGLSLDPATDWSIGCWLKLTADTGSQLGIMNFGAFSWCVTWSGATNAFYIANRIDGSNAVWCLTISATPYIDGNWHSFVITWDTSGSGTMEVFADGVSVGTFNPTAVGLSVDTPALGRSNIGGSYALDGPMDNVAVWGGIILDATDISNWHNAGAGCQLTSAAARTFSLRGMNATLAERLATLRGQNKIVYADREYSLRGVNAIMAGREFTVRGQNRTVEPSGFRLRGKNLLLSPREMTLRGKNAVLSPIAVTIRGKNAILVSRSEQLRGYNRVAVNGIELYELYMGTDAEPDPDTDAPYDTSATLAFTVAGLPVSHTYYFVVRLRDRYNLVSRNYATWSVTVAADGTATVDAPSSPQNIRLSQAAGGTIRIRANYLSAFDALANRADYWLIYLTSNGTDPALATPITQAFNALDGVDGAVKLDYTTGAYADGTWIRARVRVRRSSDTVDSANVDNYDIYAETGGPDVSHAGTHLGSLGEVL